MTALTAGDVISALQLSPHPEGGFYRETFRDTCTDAAGRAASTAIYFLLPAGMTSHWHRVDAAEVWHWHAGAALKLSIAESPSRLFDITLGADVLHGEQPQAVVPAGAWQQAESLGAWTLAGCTVAPGFEFSGFEIAARGRTPGDI